jgi:hypothetical protein
VKDLTAIGCRPYTLRWTLLVTEPITDTGYALTATGDLICTGGPSSRTVRGRDHLQLASQRDQTAAALAELAAAAGVRRQPPVGDGARRGEPAPGAAPPPPRDF